MTSFIDTEKSLQSGRPAYLFKFARTGIAWYATNVEQDIVLDSITYVAHPISVNAMRQSGDAKADDLQITLPSNAAVCVYLDSLTPTSGITVTIRKLHIIEDLETGLLTPPELVDAPVAWVGELISVSRPSLLQRVLVCNTLSLSMSRSGLRLTWSRNCPYALYGRGCKVDKAQYGVALTSVDVIDNVTLGAAEFVVGGAAVAFTRNITDSGGDLSKWILSTTRIGSTYSSVTVDSTIGNTAPSYLLSFDESHNIGEHAVMKRNFKLLGATTVLFKVDVRFGNYGQSIIQVMNAVDGIGGIKIAYLSSVLYIKKSDSNAYWPFSGTSLASTSISLSAGVWYRFEIEVDVASTQTVTAKVYNGSSLLATVSATDTFTLGSFCGVANGTPDDAGDRWRVYYDNFDVTASGNTSVGDFAGGFIEWESSTGVLERAGIESLQDGSVTLFGTTRGMATGANFIAYPGCNRTPQDCDSRYDNMLNYGGVNHLKGKSPFDGSPIF